MILKQDAILLLTELKENGINVDNELSQTFKSPNVSLEVLKKINDNRPLELTKFYNKIRESYNKKRSKLYINIMKSDENAIKDNNIALTTLSALLNQILQYKTDDIPMFLNHSRAKEIIQVLNIYCQDYSTIPAYKLLHLIKSDIIVLEIISNHRK